MLPRLPFASISTRILAALLCFCLAACNQQPASTAGTETQASSAARIKVAKETQAAIAALPLDELRSLASKATREQRLYFPAGDNAVEYYLALRKKSDKPDPLTESALMDLTPYTVIAAEQAIARSDFEDATRLRDLIANIDAGAPALPRISQAISDGMASDKSLALDETKRQQDILLATQQAELKIKQDALKSAPPETETKPLLATPVVSTAQKIAPEETIPLVVAPTPARILAATPSSTLARKLELVALRTPDPSFPSDALNRGLSGAVEIEFVVQKNGDVSEVRVVNSSQRAFDRNVLMTVKRWKFGPLDEPMTVRRSFNFNNPS